MSRLNKLNETYTAVYKGLTELREAFHISGTIDDSNAKLDEVAKLFTTYLAFTEGKIAHFPDANSDTLIPDLQAAFKVTAGLDEYKNQDGISIFGESPSLVFKKSDRELASQVVGVVRDSVNAAINLKNQGIAFDLLNEAFGHFVRDNFRGNVEDAQYMTPPEVVKFMVDLAFNDLAQETNLLSSKSDEIVIMDPTCGVGSFLTASFHKAKQLNIPNLERLTIVGQDKVERMVRLTKINFALFSAGNHFAYSGNSLSDSSPLGSYTGKVDVILTNPPFGARIPGDFVKKDGSQSMPFLSRLATSKNKLDSEILFVEKNLEMLKPGGRMLIIVPDGVVSARGLASTLRDYLQNRVEIRAIFDLPTETFAQAGTRTKTALVYIVKNKPTKDAKSVLGVIENLGFKVSLKKGVQTKVFSGTNELDGVINTLGTGTGKKDLEILSESPSIVRTQQSVLAESGWTPLHYSASRIRMIDEIASQTDVDVLPLTEVASFKSKERRAEKPIQGGRFISVLHLLSEGVLDFKAIEGYSPITPGYIVHPGEVLISKINPRIPRVCVVPDFGVPTQCSTEFEVLKPLKPMTSSELAFLLQTAEVQGQIQKLTSGTSSSHNRIKTRELEQVFVPVAKPGSKSLFNHKKRMVQYQEALEQAQEGLSKIAKIRSSLSKGG